MADPINQQPKVPQILDKKDYGYGVSSQSEFNTPDYQTPQQPQQQSQAEAPPQVQPVQQLQAPVFRQSAGGQDATSRLLNFAKANVGAGTQRMQQGIQQGLQNQAQQTQQKIKGFGAQDANKVFGLAQNQANVAQSLGNKGGFQNLITGALKTQSPQRAGLENFMLRSTPGAYTNIQNTAKQGLQNTLNTGNQYLGGFNTRVLQNGKTIDNIQNYDKLSADQFGKVNQPTEEEMARDENGYLDSDYDYTYADEEGDYAPEEDTGAGQQATGLIGSLGMLGKGAQKVSPYLQAGNDMLAKKTGVNLNAATDFSNPKGMLMAASGASAAQAAASKAQQAGQAAASKAAAAGQKVASQAAKVASSAVNTAKAAASRILGGGGGGGGKKKWYQCHAENTKVLMSDNSIKLIKDINVGDFTMFGGEVLSIKPSPASDTYKYNDVIVTGFHVVYEDNNWIRVKDSNNSVYLGTDVIVYPIITENHVIITDDNTIWGDYSLSDSSYFNLIEIDT